MNSIKDSRKNSSIRFETILDTDNVELFNRDTLYQRSYSLMNLIETKRSEFYHNRKRFTIIFISMIAIFTILSLMFLISALRNANDNFDLQQSDQYQIHNLDLQLFNEALHFQETCKQVHPNDRIDCNPDEPISQEICYKRGCCWNPIQTFALPPLNVPYCYFNPDQNGYKIVMNSSTQSHIQIRLRRVKPSGFPNDIENVKIDIFELNDNTVRIKITDLEKIRYEVPVPELNIPLDSLQSNRLYTIDLNGNVLSVRRVASSKAIFETNLAQLIFANQFLQLNTKLPSDFIYGLGEHRDTFRKATNWKRYTMLNRDQIPLPNYPLYGSHPFYLTVEEDHPRKFASGVFLFNSNPMDIITQPQPSITFRTIGGILDFFLFFGPDPEQVVQQYQKLIGLPQMPPFWSLGFHLSRYGYKNMTNLNDTFVRNRDEKIPIDVQWTDIDIMDSNNDFTVDSKNFKELPDWIRNVLHANGIRYIPMFDCGISAGEKEHSYPPYYRGLEMNVFVKNHTGDLFVGKVWNTKSTVWPDFFHPNASEYWAEQFKTYHKILPFDGAWIDMNEPSNFFDGQIDGCPNNELENPPYVPGRTEQSLTLRRKTLCMSALHYHNISHYNYHNIYGLQEAVITNRALQHTLPGKRPFIISRSTAPGHGNWASHWSGDIISDWPSMQWSIATLLNFNMFGIPMVGADICGFNGNTTEELCARWHQLGAFYTFARNHNTDDGIDQDPAALGPRVVNAARNALLMRYAHLSYLYTQFYFVHRYGGTVIKPLFFIFPFDRKCYEIETQFMWGEHLMIAPVLSPNKTEISIYFPKGEWFFAGDFRQISSHGGFISIPAHFTYPNVFYRAGSIIPIQKPGQTTDETRKENLTLIVTLEDEENSFASGRLYWDSGDDIESIRKEQYNLYYFEIKNKSMIIRSVMLGYPSDLCFDEILILGFRKEPKSIKIDDKVIKFFYNQTERRLSISNLQLRIFTENRSMIFHQINWIF
ncbi:hemicentin-1-like [Sarcoptes scabiei]|nr:hemicentin-1-like [Sarcoptes scabiei]